MQPEFNNPKAAFRSAFLSRVLGVLAKGILVLAGLLSLFTVGVGIRYAVLAAQVRVQGRQLPFTLESALEFRRIGQVYRYGRLPEQDACIQYPRGIHVRSADTVGAEYAYAALARLFPAYVPLAMRLRWIEMLWFCLGIPLLALWVGWWTRSYWSAAVAGGFYAVSLASVMRSTGQEFSHENNALPFFIGFLALDALAGRMKKTGSWFLVVLASSVALGLSLALWDMMQFFILLWAVAHFAAVLRGPGWVGSSRAGLAWLIQTAGLLLAGGLNPYLRAHGFLLSPPMLLNYGVGLIAIFRTMQVGRDAAGWPGSWRRMALGAIIGFLPLLVGCWLAPAYSESYGHFVELLAAKIEFLNRKPADPALLSFAQRILWVPALHSATWGLVLTHFPVILVLTLPALLLVCLTNSQSESKYYRCLFFYAASLIAYGLLVRFHVFTIVFAAGFLGFFASWALARAWWIRVTVLAFLAAGIGMEANRVLRTPEQWGRPNIYYAEVRELTQKLKADVAPAPVLANFGISASILTYGGCPILLHPKFESQAIRDRVREYGELLFKGTERQFRDWADERGAKYYVHALGEFATVAEDLQMRYMVDALNPPTNAPARLFEFAPDQGRFFKMVWGNRKYRLFRILTREDEAYLARRLAEAEEAFQAGELERAERCAADVVRLDEHSTRAMWILLHVASLREKGFSHSGHETE